MIELKLDNKGNGIVNLGNNRKVQILGKFILCEYKYSWSWKKFKFDYWLTKTGGFWTKKGMGDINKVKKFLKKEYNIKLI